MAEYADRVAERRDFERGVDRIARTMYEIAALTVIVNLALTVLIIAAAGWID